MKFKLYEGVEELLIQALTESGMNDRLRRFRERLFMELFNRKNTPTFQLYNIQKTIK